MEENFASEETPKDFFISYAEEDWPQVKWINQQLEGAGYSTILAHRDFSAGGNVIHEIDKGTRAKRTIAVLSPDYLNSPFAQLEWTSALYQDPTGMRGVLLPILIRPCNVQGILASLIYIDLIDQRNEEKAKETLLAGVKQAPKQLKAVAFTSFQPSEQVSSANSMQQNRFGAVKLSQKTAIVILCLISISTILGLFFWSPIFHASSYGNTGATPSPISHASPYDNAVATQGIQFGVDAAHTRFNPYEKIITPENVFNLRPLWLFPARVQGNFYSSPAVTQSMIYIASFDGNLYAFDSSCHANCQPLWSYLIGINTESSPAVVNGVVYIGSSDGNLYAFDASCQKDCQPLWSYTTGGEIRSSPSVANASVYVGSLDQNLYAFDASCQKDCQPLWSYKTDGPIYSSPAVSKDSNLIYIGSYDDYFYAFDASCQKDCQPLWSYKTDGPIYSSATVANGKVYIGSRDHKFYAFDASCRSACQPLWSYKTGDEIFSSAAATASTIYVGSNDHRLYAFDASCQKDCQPLWSYLASDFFASPTIANN